MFSLRPCILRLIRSLCRRCLLSLDVGKRSAAVHYRRQGGDVISWWSLTSRLTVHVLLWHLLWGQREVSYDVETRSVVFSVGADVKVSRVTGVGPVEAGTTCLWWLDGLVGSILGNHVVLYGWWRLAGHLLLLRLR